MPIDKQLSDADINTVQEEVSAWQLPLMDKASNIISGKKPNQKNRADTSSNEKIDYVSSSKKSGRLTVQELKEITETARLEGFQQGLEQGTEHGIREGTKVGEKAGQQRAYAEAKKDIEALQTQLKAMASTLFDPLQQQDQLIQNILVDVAINIAKKIVQEEISIDPEKILKNIERVIADIPKGASYTRISLCDDDADALEKLMSKNDRGWNLVRDNSLDSGGCIVETDASLVDFSIESRTREYLNKIDLVGDAKVSDAPPDYSGDALARSSDKVNPESNPEQTKPELPAQEKQKIDKTQINEPRADKPAADKQANLEKTDAEVVDTDAE